MFTAYTAGMQFKALKSLLMITLVLSIVACSKAKNRPQGGQDSGGGDTTLSSPEAVEFYFKKINSFIFVITEDLFRGSFREGKNKEIVEKILRRTSAVYNEQHIPDVKSKYSRFTGTSDGIYALSKFELHEGYCSSKDKVHAAGSVKELKIGSPVCISKAHFLKIPPSSLEREMIGIFLHEYVHLLGLGEEDAIGFQNAFLTNYSKLYPNGVGLYLSTSENNELLESWGFIGEDSFYSDTRLFETPYNKIVSKMKAGNKISSEERKEMCHAKREVDSYVYNIASYIIKNFSKNAGDFLTQKIYSEQDIDNKIAKVETLVSKINYELALQAICGDDPIVVIKELEDGMPIMKDIYYEILNMAKDLQKQTSQLY